MKKVISLLLIFVVVLSGCGAEVDDNVIVYSSGTPESLNINEVAYTKSMKVLADANQTLYEYDRDGNIVLAGATNTEISDDELVYTISLNPELVWVDNTGEVMGDVTASDYVFAYQNMVNPEINGSLNYLFAPIKNADEVRNGEVTIDELGVKAVDDLTLEITLEAPTPYFLSMLANVAFAPQPEGAYEMYGDNYTSTAEYTWYSGAFYISVYDVDYQVEMLKNENYYDANNVEVSGVNYRIIDDSESAITAFDDGLVDYAEVKEANVYEDYSDVVIDNQSSSVNFIRMNSDEDNITSNKDLRRALYYSFDREGILNSVYGEINTPVDHLVPEGLTPPAYDGAEYYEGESYGGLDEELALEYLDEYMTENSISDPADIVVTYLTSDSDKSLEIATLIQANFQQKLGITLDLNVVASSSYYDLRSEGSYDMIGGIWVPDYSDPSTYLDMFITENIGGSNQTRFSNAEYDALADDARYESDTDTRFEMYHDLEDMVFDNYLVIPFYQMNEPFLLSEEFTTYNTATGIITNKYTEIND